MSGLAGSALLSAYLVTKGIRDREKRATNIALKALPKVIADKKLQQQYKQLLGNALKTYGAELA